jgi:hypothetical protein
LERSYLGPEQINGKSISGRGNSKFESLRWKFSNYEEKKRSERQPGCIRSALQMVVDCILSAEPLVGAVFEAGFIFPVLQMRWLRPRKVKYLVQVPNK